jgi:hypothetical protein
MTRRLSNSHVKPKSKKLKFLCLHGYQNTKEIFEYQSRSFRSAFSDIAEFYIIESNHVIENAETPKSIIERGFK